MKSNHPNRAVRLAGGVLMLMLMLMPLLWVAGAAAATGVERASVPHPPMVAPPDVKATQAPPVRAKLVDINSASRAELKTLPGVGDAEATRIIAGRPYLSKADLVLKNVMPKGPYLQLRHHVVAMPKARAKGKA